MNAIAEDEAATSYDDFKLIVAKEVSSFFKLDKVSAMSDIPTQSIYLFMRRPEGLEEEIWTLSLVFWRYISYLMNLWGWS